MSKETVATPKTSAKPKRTRKIADERPVTKGSPEQLIGCVTVFVPKGCTRTGLSIDALDSHSRNLATQTVIAADLGVLLCRGFKRVTVGGEDCLQITLRPESYHVTEQN